MAKNSPSVAVIAICLLIVSALFVGLPAQPAMAATAEKIFYAEGGTTDDDYDFMRIDTDGTGSLQIKRPTSLSSGYFDLAAVDNINQKVYFYERDSITANIKIYQADLDGGNRIEWLIPTETTYALSAYNGKVFYSPDTDDDEFYWRSAGGGDPTVIAEFTDSHKYINYSAVDSATGYLYYCVYDPGDDPSDSNDDVGCTIYQTSADSPQGPGSGATLVKFIPCNLIALEAYNGVVYYALGTDLIGTDHDYAYEYCLMRIDYDGSDETKIYYAPYGLVNLIAAAPSEGKLYFYDTNADGAGTEKTFKIDLPGSLVTNPPSFATLDGVPIKAIEIYSPSEPEMNLKQGSTDIASGGSYDFSDQSVGSDADVVFTIENTGGADLTVSTSLSVGGTDYDQFSIQQQPTSPVTGGSSTTFTVRFSPTSTGAKSASISITNNDSDENPYVLNLSGTGVAPEMDVQGNSVSIADEDTTPDPTDHTDFGNADIATGSVVRTFTIYNTGSAALNLDGDPKVAVGGDDAADFTVSLQPTSPVASGGGSTTFQVTFDPTTTGVKSATISIDNDDSDEDPYNFAIQGTGTSAPEMDVQGNSVSIADEDTTPDPTDHTDFGNAEISTETVVRTFTIYNTGSAALNLDGDPKVAVSGDDAADFTVSLQPTSPVAAGGGSTTFQVTFNPSDVGLRTATISIDNDDSDEDPYNFAIQGTGTSAPVIGNLDGDSVTFTEGTAVLLDANGDASVSDADAGGYNGGNVSVAIDGGGTANEDFGVDGTNVTSGGDGTIAAGETIAVGGTDIGTVDASDNGQNGNDLVINLNADANDARLSTLLQNINYNNDSDDPGGTRTVDFTVNDGSYTSDTASVTVTLQGVNDPPTLTATGQDPTFTEGGAAVDLFSGVSIDTVETGQNIEELVLTMTNVNDGADEIMNIDGSDVALTDGNSVITATNGMTVNVSCSTATVTISKAGGIGTAAMQTLVDGMTYRNTSDNPDTSNRVVTLTSIKDTGGTDYGGNDTTALAVTSTVTITAVNDQPVINNINGDSVDVIAADSPVLIDENSDAAVSDVDSADFDSGNLTVAQATGTTNGNFGVDGTNVTSGGDATIAGGETIAVGGTAIGTVDATNDGQGGNDLVINFNASATLARIETLIRNLTYAAPSGIGARTFDLTVNDGDGTANGGSDTSDASTFTVNVNPNPPAIANLDGDNLDYDPSVGGEALIDIGGDTEVTDADSANFNGGNLTVTIATGGTPTEDLLGIDTSGTVSVAGTTVSVGGTDIGTITSDGTGGNDLIVDFNANATPARVTTLVRALSYENTNNVDPSGAMRHLEITTTDDSAATSNTAEVTVTILLPEINLKQGATDIADGGTYDFGSQLVDSDTDVIFTIENTGTANLNLTLPLTITGANADQFSIPAQPTSPVTAGNNTTFTVRFSPSSTGAKTAAIAIANNDLDEDPYDLNLTGNGVTPEMDVQGNSVSIADGDTTPSLADHTDFGEADIATETVVRTFTIINTGSAELNLSGDPKVVVGGAHAADFTISLQPTSPVASGGGSTTFQVTFAPSATGLRSATLSIANDDLDEDPYNFSIQGTGITPEINLKQGDTDIADGDTYDFGNKMIGSSIDVVFTIENTGDGNLNLTLPLTIGGANADQFSIPAQPTSPVAPAGTTTFTVRFYPTSIGTKTAAIAIANNDNDEDPYDLTLTGTGVSPAAPAGGGGDYQYHYGTVSIDGTEQELITNAAGEVKRSVNLTSADGKLEVSIPRGTLITDSDGQGVHNITIVTDSELPPPPAGAHIIALGYDFGPDGTIFDPPITITFHYDEGELTEGVDEESLVLAFYDSATGLWVELKCTVDPVNNCVTALMAHCTQFAIIGQVVATGEVSALPADSSPTGSDSVAVNSPTTSDKASAPTTAETTTDTTTPTWLFIGAILLSALLMASLVSNAVTRSRY